MDNSNPFSTVALKFGAYSAVCSFAVFLAVYFAGYCPLGQSSWLAAWIPVLFIYLGAKQYKHVENNGLITFGEAFRMGLLISISYSFLITCAAYVFGTIYAPDLIDLYKFENIEKLKQSKEILSKDWYNSFVKATSLVTMKSFTVADFVNKVFGGLLASLLVAAILKNTDIKENTEPES